MKRVKDVMSLGLTTVPATMDLVSLARLFCRHRISGAPVVDAEGVMVGMISQTDLTRARACEDDLFEVLYSPAGRDAWVDQLRDEEYGPHPEEEWGAPDGHGSGLVVADLMNRTLHTIEEEASVRDAARAMLELGVRRLPVTREGKVRGMVSASDLVRAWTTELDRPPTAAARLERDFPLRFRQLSGAARKKAADMASFLLRTEGLPWGRAAALALDRTEMWLRWQRLASAPPSERKKAA